MSSFFDFVRTPSKESVDGKVAVAGSAPVFSSSGKLLGGDVDETLSNRSSSQVYYLPEVEGICGGLIGSGSKFCCKSPELCSVISHKKSPFKDLGPGLYIKDGDSESLHTSPSLSNSYLCDQLVYSFLSRSFDSAQEVSRYFSMVRSSNFAPVLSLDHLEGQADKMAKAESLKTPARKRKGEDLQEYFQDWVDLTKLGDGDMDLADGKDLSPNSKGAEKFIYLLRNLVDAASSDQTALSILEKKSKRFLCRLELKMTEKAHLRCGRQFYL